MRRIVTDPEAPGFVRMGEGAVREPAPTEVLVNVEFFSINRGEVNFAKARPNGSPIGWDFAGTVAKAPKNSELQGKPVVGFSRAQEAWAEQVLVPEIDVAERPEEVSASTAAALPVAAGTALVALEAAGALLGRRVLVTGATGGVGGFAVQLAKAAGATVVAQVRRAEQVDYVKNLGADEVAVLEQGAGLAAYGPLSLVVDGLGGSMLAGALPLLDADGLAVNYGVTAEPELSLPLGMLLGKGRAQLRGLNLYAVSEVEAPKRWLARLLELVKRKHLKVDVVERGSWAQTPEAAADLLARKFHGKAVLKVD